MFKKGDIIQWCWHADKQQHAPFLRVLGTSSDNYYYKVFNLSTGEEEVDEEWEVVGSPSGYWKKRLTSPPTSDKVLPMDKPEVGDIWRWDDQWTVLLIKKTRVSGEFDKTETFLGIALEDGWQGKWEFGGSINNLWEKLA